MDLSGLPALVALAVIIAWAIVIWDDADWVVDELFKGGSE